MAPRRNDDHEKRKQVEDIAIEVATKFFESKAGGCCVVKSVEFEYKGWDLEAVGNSGTLLIEVKGLSGSVPIAELTPNEYKNMQKHKGSYVLFVVTGCLLREIKTFDFRYMFDAKRWETLEGDVLDVVPKTAAVIRALPTKRGKI